MFYFRFQAAGFDALAVVLLVLFAIFLFYSINFIYLDILITSKSLKLKFGVFHWTIHLDNIENAQLDQIPVFMRLGGAGVHFMFIRNRYRVSFNFLEYPRVVVALKDKKGPVQDVSFSTRNADRLIKLLQGM